MAAARIFASPEQDLEKCKALENTALKKPDNPALNNQAPIQSVIVGMSAGSMFLLGFLAMQGG